MKDILLTVKFQKSEIKWIIASFCVAVLTNIVSILVYNTAWTEIYSQILWVLIIACVYYAISVAFSVMIFLIKRFVLK